MRTYLISLIFVFAFNNLTIAQEKTEDTLGHSLSSDAMFQFMIRNYAKGDSLATEAIKLNPKCTKAYYIRSRIRTVLQKYDEAMIDINQGIKLAPDDAGMYYAKGLLYWKKDELENAVKEFALCIQKDADHKDAYKSSGAILIQQKKYNDAIVQFDKCLEKEKYEMAPLYYERGRAYYLKGDEEKGCADMRMARKLGFKKAHSLIIDVCPPDPSDEANDVWKEYPNEKTINKTNASLFLTTDKTPESLVRCFYASRILGNDKWKNTVPAEDKQSSRIKNSLSKYDKWKFTEIKLVSKKKTDMPGQWWILIYMKIEVNGKTDGGQDEVTVEQLADGSWVIIDLPN